MRQKQISPGDSLNSLNASSFLYVILHHEVLEKHILLGIDEQPFVNHQGWDIFRVNLQGSRPIRIDRVPKRSGCGNIHGFLSGKTYPFGYISKDGC